MDFASFAGAAGSIKSAIEIARIGLAARDAVQIRDALAQVHNHLAQLQESLLDTTIKASGLASELHVAQEENRKLKATIEQRGRYELFQVGTGNFVMRSKVDPGSVDPVGNEPSHFACQRCFDKGDTVVLQLLQHSWGNSWGCQACKFEFGI